MPDTSLRPADADYVGLTVPEAEALASSRGDEIRVLTDVMTLAYCRDRVNVRVSDGRIAQIHSRS